MRAFLALLLLLPPVASAAARVEPASRTACIQAASGYYGVPADLIRAVIRTEGGTTGQQVRNTNGSHDMGLMQINTIHLRNPPHNLEARGITRERLMNDECLNIYIGTYILSFELSKSSADFWTNVGAYNSRTPKHNERYRAKVWDNLVKIWQGR